MSQLLTAYSAMMPIWGTMVDPLLMGLLLLGLFASLAMMAKGSTVA
jgi:hypothetical protein